jgi:uncharacterized lipoprotein YddW (UPF0748 family)
MTGKILLPVTGIVCLLSLMACTHTRHAAGTPAKHVSAPAAVNNTPSGPQVMSEFRAAWVATVANINWPSKPGLSTQEQQQEAITLLDYLKEHHFNAVIFQVRPMADALYKSDLEPWSYFLTGAQGKAPDPYYDPLQFWVEAAHDRGLELHVWLNPYRAYHPAGKEISDQSIVKTNPELVIKLKQGYYWMDPSKKETQDHTVAVVKDIVKRYDIDGVHLDDYFYPYSEYNGGEDFPDDSSWAAYQAGGGTLSRGDWRRASVNTLIERLYKEIKAEKKYVKFGISPFGMWRPGYPASISGFDQYGQLYADARLWLNKGWLDYFSPQLYWRINDIPHSFPVLLGWWSQENTQHRHLWPGMSVGDTSAKGVNETLSQVMITRGMLPQSMGAVHWSISSLTRNPNMSKALVEGPYLKNAIVPSSPWLSDRAPQAPVAQAAVQGDQVHITWSHPDEKNVFRWVVYYQYGSTWTYQVLNRGDRSLEVPRYSRQKAGQAVLNEVRVSAVDRTGYEGEKTLITVVQ